MKHLKHSISLWEERKICAYLCWIVSSKCIGMNFTFTWTDLFCSSTRAGRCLLWSSLNSAQWMPSPWLTLWQNDLSEFSYTVSMRRQKLKYTATGTWILCREDKEVYDTSVLFYDKENPLVPKNSQYCVHYHVGIMTMTIRINFYWAL